MAFKYCVKTSLSPDSRAATRKLNASLVLLLISSNFMIFPFCRLRLFVSSLHAAAEQTGEDDEREKTAPGEGGRARGAARCVPNAEVLDFSLAQHRRMSPSDRGSHGRRAYTRGRHSEGKTRSYLGVSLAPTGKSLL